MASNPNFTAAPRVGHARIATANAGRDGSGTLGELLAGVAAGTRIDRVQVRATGTTTAGMIRLFYFDGTNYRLLGEIIVAAITPGAAVKAWEGELVRADGLPLALLPGTAHKLFASTNNAEQFDVLAFGGDF